MVPGVEGLGDGVGLAAEDRMPFLVLHGAVVEDVEQLVVAGGIADLGDENLDLVRLHLVREDLPERLRVRIGERAGVDVLA